MTRTIIGFLAGICVGAGTLIAYVLVLTFLDNEA